MKQASCSLHTLGLAAAFGMSLALSTHSSMAAEQVTLAPHRAVYDLVLDTKVAAKGIDSAKSRIVFDFTGDACDGYQLNFRQVTALDVSEGGRRVIDARTSNFESGDGQQFRFISESSGQGTPPEKTNGEARREGDAYKVTIKLPQPGDFSFGGDALFPSAQLKAVIRAARAGETTLNLPMFDGSEEGRQVYDTLSVIGRKIAGGPSGNLEAALRKPTFDGMARWPVTISYFKRGAGEITPSYRVSFELFDNGVTRAIRLDYGDFAMVGEFTKLDMLEPGNCAK